MFERWQRKQGRGNTSTMAKLLPGKTYDVEDELSLLQQAQAEGKVVLVQSVE